MQCDIPKENTMPLPTLNRPLFLGMTAALIGIGCGLEGVDIEESGTEGASAPLSEVSNLTGSTNLSGASNLSGSTNLSGVTNLTGTSNLSNVSNLTGVSNLSGTTNLTGASNLSGVSNLTGVTNLTVSTNLTGASNLVGVDSSTLTVAQWVSSCTHTRIPINPSGSEPLQAYIPTMYGLTGQIAPVKDSYGALYKITDSSTGIQYGTYVVNMHACSGAMMKVTLLGPATVPSVWTPLSGQIKYALFKFKHPTTGAATWYRMRADFAPGIFGYVTETPGIANRYTFGSMTTGKLGRPAYWATVALPGSSVTLTHHLAANPGDLPVALSIPTASQTGRPVANAEGIWAWNLNPFRTYSDGMNAANTWRAAVLGKIWTGSNGTPILPFLRTVGSSNSSSPSEVI